MTPINMHATAVLLGDRGVVIAGPSGSGKTALALALIDKARISGLFARLVSDDQLFLSASAGHLVCHAPATIAGLIEIRGLGPSPVAHEAAAAVDLLVRLAPATDIERLPEPASEILLGCSIPKVMLAEREVIAALPVVFARLGLLPSG